MRQVLQSLGMPEHVGLAYDTWAPVGDDGKVPDNDRDSWLAELTRISVSPDYAQSFKRWEASFRPPVDRTFELELTSRLLIGHGNSSASDVGLTVHQTWGVPVIPGSALKGLLAHFVDAIYGPEDPTLPPWEQQPESERKRADYQGVTWRGERIERGPGAIYRALFGAPDAETDEAMRGRGFDAGAAAGIVTFHDALYMPQRNGVNDTPFIPDVLTVHQKQYYDTGGGAWPSDYDSPNPVAFLTVSSGVRMLFALSGPPDWTQLTEQLLRGALEKWGVGGKTSAGYGRLIAPEHRPANILSTQSTVTGGLASPKVGDRVEAELLEQRTKRGGWKARHKSGLEGPIQNNDHVSSDKKAGDLIPVIVKIAKGRESAFMVNAARSKVDPSKGGGK